MYSQKRPAAWPPTTGGRDRGISSSTTESSGRGVGDRRLTGRKWLGTFARQEQAWLRALRGPGHLGPQPASFGQAPLGPGRGEVRGGHVQTQDANRLTA